MSSSSAEHATADTPEPISPRDSSWRLCSRALPLTQREVIVLNRYRGMSYAEIGDVLGISENAFKQRAFHAMQKLGRSLHTVQPRMM